MSKDAIRVGFFGKLPSRGDFVRAAMSRTLADTWDAWLKALLPAAQERLGEAWSEAWHATRPWHFAIPHGVCGACPVSGVWLASADKVGRAFPLMIAAQSRLSHSFLEAAEDLGREAIADAMGPETLASRLDRLPRRGSSAPIEPGAARWWRRLGQEMICSNHLPDVDVFVGMLTP